MKEFTTIKLSDNRIVTVYCITGSMMYRATFAAGMNTAVIPYHLIPESCLVNGKNVNMEFVGELSWEDLNAIFEVLALQVDKLKL